MVCSYVVQDIIEEAAISDQLTVHHLDVPGSTLRYEVRGSGPAVVDRRPTDAAVTDRLAINHTVVT